MKLMRVLQKVYCEPWLIRPDFHARIADIVKLHAAGNEAQIKANLAMMGLDIEEPEDIECEMIGAVAVLPIQGVIGKRVGMLQKTSGVTDIDEVSALFNSTMADPSVKAILLDIDSPGGTVGGVMEFAELIRDCRSDKPVWAFTDGDMDSAAYWIGSACGHIAATSSACVGSIGVYLPLIDQSRAYEMAGYKAEVIKAGELKAIGVPGTSLTSEQRAHLQSQVDYLCDMFKASVNEGRGKTIDPSFMQGQALYAPQALAAGLIDDVVSNRQEVIDGLNKCC
jgi:signal peptide peptidase SppA